MTKIAVAVVTPGTGVETVLTLAKPGALRFFIVGLLDLCAGDPGTEGDRRLSFVLAFSARAIGQYIHGSRSGRISNNKQVLPAVSSYA